MTLRRATVAQPARTSQTTKAGSDSDEESSGLRQRPALVTISQNTRRNKSRLGFVPDDDHIEDSVVVVGTKRKRPAVAAENALAGSSQPRMAKRFKRSASPVDSGDDDDDEKAMDTENDDEEHSEQFYLQTATRSQLLKLKKYHLVDLYREAQVARPTSDPESLTRALLAQAIIQARTLPRRGAANRAPKPRVGHGQAPFTPDSDDYRGKALRAAAVRRHATEPDLNHYTSPPLGRSFSLNTLAKNNTRREKRTKIDSNGSTMSDEPPPVTPISPPITRKRVQSDPKHVIFYDGISEGSENDEPPRAYEPSPRRLRSRGERSSQESAPIGRHLPIRAGKPKIGDLQEDETDFDSGGSGNEGVPASSAVDTDRDEEEESDYDEDDDLSPRKLRNGKVIMPDEPDEDDEDEDEEEDQEEEGDEDEDAEARGDTDYMEEDEEAEEGAPEREASVDDEVDLSEETVKSLTRYRRDELVRLCESRNLDVDGTKPQLAKALLEWRNSRQPSSSGASTVRAPSTEAPTKRKGRPPVLDRSDRIHVNQPRTPPLSNNHGIDSVSGVTVIDEGGENEELEFDLGSLGLEDKEIPYEKLVKKEKIGSGGFKDVYSGTLGSRKVAIAEFRGTLTPMDIKELQLLRDLSHDNIVRFFGVSVPDNTKETPVVMISELCTNGDLFDYIRNEGAPSLSRVLRLMSDIASGLEYLHKRKPSIIHRDCKSSNILITRNGRAKIADFGLAKVKQSTRSMVRSLVGTVNWQAPELWHAHPKYDYKVDVFSCAMVFWEILQWHLPNKKFPWEGMNEHAIYDAVGSKRQRPSISGLKKQWCPEVVDLVESMWSQDPRDRPTMSEIVVELESIKASY